MIAYFDLTRSSSLRRSSCRSFKQPSELKIFLYRMSSTYTFTDLFNADRALCEAQDSLGVAVRNLETAIAAQATADPSSSAAEPGHDPVAIARDGVHFATAFRDRCFLEHREVYNAILAVGYQGERNAGSATQTPTATSAQLLTPSAAVSSALSDISRRLSYLESAQPGSGGGTTPHLSAVDVARVTALEAKAQQFSPLKRKLDDLERVVTAAAARPSPVAVLVTGYPFITAATAATMSHGACGRAYLDPNDGGCIVSADGLTFKAVFHKNPEEAMLRLARSIFPLRVLEPGFMRALSLNEQGAFISIENVSAHVETSRQSLANPQMATPGTASLWLGEDLIITPLCSKASGDYSMIHKLYLGKFALNPTDDHTPFTLAVLPVAIFDPARERTMEFVRRLLRAWLTAFETFFGTRGQFSWEMAFAPILRRCVQDSVFKYLEVDFVVDAIANAFVVWFSVVSRNMPRQPHDGTFHHFGVETSRRLLCDLFDFPADHSAVQSYNNRVNHSLGCVVVPRPAPARALPVPDRETPSIGMAAPPSVPAVSVPRPTAASGPQENSAPHSVSFCLAAFLDTIGFTGQQLYKHKYPFGGVQCLRKHPSRADIVEHLESYFVPAITRFYPVQDDKSVIINLARAFVSSA